MSAQMSMFGPHRLPRRRQLIDHALHFRRARRPVELIVLVGIGGLIQVELDGGIAVIDGLRRHRGELLGRGQPRLIQRRVAVDADLVAELPAEQLIHRHVQRLAGQIPQRRFHGRQHRHEDARLCAAEDAALPHLLEDPMHVERVLAANPLTEALDEVVGAADRIDSLAAAPDALVRMDFHEQAAADVAALQIGDAQRGRARRLLRALDGLPECGTRAARRPPPQRHRWPGTHDDGCSPS